MLSPWPQALTPAVLLLWAFVWRHLRRSDGRGYWWSPALRLRGDYLGHYYLGFAEIIRVVLVNIDSALGFKLTGGASGPHGIPLIPATEHRNCCFACHLCYSYSYEV